jgi:hypothetical protein
MTLKEAYNIYISLGLSSDKAKLATAQTALETADKDPKTGGYSPFLSRVFLQNNNVGGIMYVNQPYQKDSTQGFQMPLSDTGGKIAYYAKFGSLKSSFNDHLRIIYNSLMKSTNVTEFAKNLKAQKYYGADVNKYILTLQRFERELNKELGTTTEKKK